MRNDDYQVNDSASASYDAEFCKVTAFVFHNTLRLLRDLMCAVRLSDINQVMYMCQVMIRSCFVCFFSLSHYGFQG
jgi:hypothetical protein